MTKTRDATITACTGVGSNGSLLLSPVALKLRMEKEIK